jgi:hypothetical protein
MRLRTTAPPNAFLMLNPKRQFGSPLARTKTVKWELERRLPARYTSSNSLFRTSRASRGNVRPAAGPVPLLRREPMTALLAARRQHFAAAFGLHAHAKPVCFGAAASPRLKCTLWQSIPPLVLNRAGNRPANTSCPSGRAACCRRFPAPAGLALGSSLVQPDRPRWGSIRNYLVYFNSPKNASPRARAQGQENAVIHRILYSINRLLLQAVHLLGF